MPNKIAAAAAAKVQLQQQYPFESIQNVKLPLSTKFQFAAFTSLISWKSAAAAAAAAAAIKIFFDFVILILIQNEEKSMSFRKKFQAV